MNSAKPGFLGVEKEERKITLVAFAYIFFVICAYYVIKPIRGSLGMELGKDNIPVLSLLSMLVLIASNAVYSVIVGLYKRDVFIPSITRFFAACLLVFWLLFSFVFPAVVTESSGSALALEQTLAEVPANEITASATGLLPTESLMQTNPARGVAIAVFYLWVGVFALMAVSMFWSFMNDVLSVGQSKRLYAIIGYGGLIGGAVGSVITEHLVPVLGTANLFLVALAILYPSIWCMRYIHHNYVAADSTPSPKPPEQPAHPPRPWDGLLSVWHAPILLFMAFEMFIFTFSSTLFYQQLYEMVNQTFSGETDATTGFFAGFFGKITILSLFSQFFITRLFMKFRNPVTGLFIFPLLQVAASVIMLVSPSLGIVSWGLIIGSAINYSTGRAIRELVYIPLDREQKYQGKGFVDTVVFRLGDGLSAVILIGGLELFSYGVWIDWTILSSMILQFYVIVKIAGLYAEKIEAGKQTDSSSNA